MLQCGVQISGFEISCFLALVTAGPGARCGALCVRGCFECVSVSVCVFVHACARARVRTRARARVRVRTRVSVCPGGPLANPSLPVHAVQWAGAKSGSRPRCVAAAGDGSRSSAGGSPKGQGRSESAGCGAAWRAPQVMTLRLRSAGSLATWHEPGPAKKPGPGTGPE
jgi:hypothetical protein